jgi:hypothetical protein
MAARIDPQTGVLSFLGPLDDHCHWRMAIRFSSACLHGLILPPLPYPRARLRVAHGLDPAISGRSPFWTPLPR